MPICSVHKHNYPEGDKCPYLHNGESIEDVLEERGHRYGNDFLELSIVIQNIKKCLKLSTSWDSLTEDKKEALEMIATKLGRIVMGDSNYPDNFRDIMGYSKLVLDRLLENEE